MLGIHRGHPPSSLKLSAKIIYIYNLKTILYIYIYITHILIYILYIYKGFPGSASGKESSDAGDIRDSFDL